LPLDQIYARLTEILRELFDDDTIVARPDLTADQVLGWDSFAQLQILVEVEKSFGVTFSAAQASSLKNVGELAEFIEARA
jgi:acyl carrier protein